MADGAPTCLSGPACQRTHGSARRPACEHTSGRTCWHAHSRVQWHTHSSAHKHVHSGSASGDNACHGTAGLGTLPGNITSPGASTFSRGTFTPWWFAAFRSSATWFGFAEQAGNFGCSWHNCAAVHCVPADSGGLIAARHDAADHNHQPATSASDGNYCSFKHTAAVSTPNCIDPVTTNRSPAAISASTDHVGVAQGPQHTPLASISGGSANTTSSSTCSHA